MSQLKNREMTVIYLCFMLIFLFTFSGAKAVSNKTLYQPIHVKGQVTGVDGLGIPGVNVLEKGTTNGTITDIDGNFTITVGNDQAVLVFSYVGYNTQEIPVDGQTQLNLTLVEDITSLEEVVVIGYGTQKKVNLSGAVDAIGNENIENRPVTNLGQALQGSLPGLNISVGNSGGEMGATMNMNIRGIGSITGGEPYILVDGIEQDINSLNPEDIESISVLKDAASSAIYGARAAFGVVLVTTKNGRKDGCSVNYSNNFSFAAPTIVPHSVNSRKFADYMNVAAKNDGNAPIFQKVILDYIDKYLSGEIDYWTIPAPFNPQMWLLKSVAWANTDWYDVCYKKWVPSRIHNLSVSGGDKKTQYFISGSVFDQEGLWNFGNDHFNRYTLNSKINTKLNEWLRFNFTSKFSSRNIERPSYSQELIYSYLARAWPTDAPYFPDGTANWEAPMVWCEQGGRYHEKNNELSIIPGFEVEPVKGWIIYSNLRWRMNSWGSTNHDAKIPSKFADGTTTFLRAQNSYATNDFTSYYTSPNIYSTYSKEIGNHSFTLLAGFEQELTKYQSTFARRYDLVSDEVPSLNTATGRQETEGTIGHFSTRSYFGRLNYAFKEKILFEFSTRYDGSSKFPAGSRWVIVPSGSAAYIISREEFWKPISDFVSMFKVRLSYGSLGNQDVGNYLYFERLQINTNLAYIMGDERPSYVGMAGLTSPGLTWEKVNTKNAGMDAGFLNNRMNMSFDYFIRNTYDMLGPAESLPAVLGTQVPRSNNANLHSKGFELSLAWKDNIGSLAYSARFVLSDVVSEVTRYFNPQKLLSAAYYEGMELGEIWGYTTAGLFQSDEEAQAVNQSYISAEVPRAGDVHYMDVNKDGKIDLGKNTLSEPGDKSIIGNSSPRYAYSLNLNASWKGLDINLIWQGIGKRDLWLSSPIFWGAGGQWWFTAYKEHMDYWTEDNQDAYWPIPRMSKGDMNKQVQTRYLQNGAYLRLKSLQLGYTIPVRLTQKAFIQNLRLYVSGENLLTFTDLFKAFDPEATGGRGENGYIYPLQKVLSGGVNITF